MATHTTGSIRGPQISDPKRPDPEDVKQLHASGEGRNSIARALGVSYRQVDRVARELGLTWNADATREASAARRTAAELDRAELAQKFRALALDSVDRALAEDDPSDRRRLAMTAESATRSDLSLLAANREGEEGSESAEQFAELLDSIRSGFDTIMDTPVEDPDLLGEFNS